MMAFGEFPYLECSSAGDKRFSAFHAKIDGKSIEEIYQGSKIFEDGSTNLSWKEAKGKRAVNAEECNEIYEALWDLYIAENPELVDVLCSASGLSDKFGQAGHMCQARSLWRIRNKYLEERKINSFLSF